MPKDISRLLAEHQLQRDLISVRRDDIDDAAIQGYVLAASSELLALQYIYDFQLDGVMLLRTIDLTDVNCSKTDRFQKELLVREGLEQQIPFGQRFEVTGWHAAIAKLANEFPLMIVECEALDEPEFAIGRVHALHDDLVDFECFTGAANWSAAIEEIALQDVTCCRVDTHYINFYRRHFERLALS